MSYWDETLTPAPPCGVAATVGETPYPFNDSADVEPAAPRLGDYPKRWDTEPHIAADDHRNEDFDMHRSGLSGPAKPGSFA